MPDSRLRIVVLGYVVRGPMGGMAWSQLHYPLGLSRLGHDVYFVEDSGDSPWCCYDPDRGLTDDNPAYGLAFARRAFAGVGLAERWAYYDAHRSQWCGPAAPRILEVCRTADVLIEISGGSPMRPWLRSIPTRVLIDTDPVFTQVTHLEDPLRRACAANYNAFFTFAEKWGSFGCSVPDDGFSWRTTRQPIVLDAWPAAAGRPNGSFTTVMQWDSYPPVEHEGLHFGMKSESFEPYFELPRHVGARLELAVGGPKAPRDRLRLAGWQVRSPLEPTRTTVSYQRYIVHSKAEFTVAKHGYVMARSGWFSERSAAYLASGRPVVTQDTGFSDHLPTGSGLFAFSTPDEAISAIEQVESRYEHHCQMARELAESSFDSKIILEDLLSRCEAPSVVAAS